MDEIWLAIRSMPGGDQCVLGFTSHKQVDKEWLQNVLSTLNYEHRFFEKGFRPTKEELKEDEDEDEDVMLDLKGFFEGLPEPKGKPNKCGKNHWITKDERGDLA